MITKRNILMDKYVVGKLLGTGSFAKVYLGKDINTEKSVAIKVIDKQTLTKEYLAKQVKREISILALIKHPNVIQIYEVIATKEKIYLILEFVKGGDLYDRYKLGKFRESVARKYFAQLICAVDVCHQNGVYHRDLKLDNLLIDEDGNIKITDFGLSAVAESKGKDGLLHTQCGTCSYMAPELIKGGGYDGVKADIWSCGVILFAMLAGYMPFAHISHTGLYFMIVQAKYTCPDWFSSEVCTLLSRMLDPNPNKRISISNIKKCPWFKRGLKAITRSTSQSEGETSVSSTHDDDNIVASEAEIEPSALNAFDIISISYNLTGLFAGSEGQNELRFTSTKPVLEIMSAFEEISKALKLKLVKKGKGLMSLEAVNEILRGDISIAAEIYEMLPCLYMVEVKMTKGDTYEYRRMIKMDIIPALKDIMCN